MKGATMICPVFIPRRSARRVRPLAVLAATLALAAVSTHASDAHTPPTAQPWTPATLRQALAALPPGDAARGRTVHETMFCASCHGERGQAPTLNWPHLAGQKAAYTAKMLLDYRDGRRLENHGALLMRDLAQMLTPQQMADVAAFYAQQPLPRDDGTPRAAVSAEALRQAERLVRHGDPARLITPCASCHGARGEGGTREAGALAGQNPLYLRRTLLDFQSGRRHNDAVKGMSTFAQRLTRTEIEALAVYYADPSAGRHALRQAAR